MTCTLNKPKPRQAGVSTRRAAASRQVSQALEAAAQLVPDNRLAAACAVFARLDTAQQWQLASELAQAREPEFARSVKNVVGMACGFRRQRADDGQEQLHPLPCVIFIVRSKWRGAPPSRGAASQTLPKHLLTFADLDGQHQLCAVPCDVQRQDRLLALQAQANSAIAVRGNAPHDMVGTIAFAVRDADDTLYAVSPIHVLSPGMPLDGRGVTENNRARRVIGQTAPASEALLTSTLLGGRLLPGPAESLDVQLALVDDTTRLRLALAGLKLSPTRPVFHSEPELAMALVKERAVILVPGNHPHEPAPRAAIRVMLSMGERLHMPEYPFGTGDHVVYHRVLELLLLDGHQTIPGDSGSAVVLQWPDGTHSLIGMHIAASENKRSSFTVPVWRLLDTVAYLQLGTPWVNGAVRVVTALA